MLRSVSPTIGNGSVERMSVRKTKVAIPFGFPNISTLRTCKNRPPAKMRATERRRTACPAARLRTRRGALWHHRIGPTSATRTTDLHTESGPAIRGRGGSNEPAELGRNAHPRPGAPRRRAPHSVQGAIRTNGRSSGYRRPSSRSTFCAARSALRAALASFLAILRAARAS